MVKIRNDIDLLKAIAITFVVLYHLFDLLKISYGIECSLFDGGFLGVDIFLVISGYLITASILKDINRNSFSILSFYKKRLTRIYPPLLILIAVCLCFGYFLLFPDVYKETAIEAVNAIVGSANIRFANSGGYFSLDNSDKLLLHTWYIALAIQFYLVAPILISLFNRVFKTKLAYSVFFFALILTVTSVLLCKNEKAYLLTQTRIFELFIGAAVFVLKDKIRSLLKLDNQKISAFTFYLALVAIFYSVFSTSLVDSFWTVRTSILVIIATSLVLLADADCIICKSKFNILGKASYSIYLWHWPLFIFALKVGLAPTVLSSLSAVLIVLFVSVVSYQLFEKRKFKGFISLLLVVLIAVSYVYIKKTEGKNYLSAYMIDTKLTFEPKAPVIDYQIDDQKVFILGKSKATPKLFITGDSHTMQFFDFFNDVFEDSIYYSAYEATMAYGPVFNTMNAVYLNIGKEKRDNFYKAYINTLSKLQNNSKVIISNNYFLHYKPYMAEFNLKDNDESFDAFIKDMIEDIDSQVQKYPHLSFNILGQGIYTTFTTAKCIKTDLKDSLLRYILKQDNCYETYDFIYEKREKINNAFKAYADKKENVHFIDRNEPLLIKENRKNSLYMTVDKNKNPLYRDNHHYTPLGGIMVGKYLIDNLK